MKSSSTVCENELRTKQTRVLERTRRSKSEFQQTWRASSTQVFAALAAPVAPEVMRIIRADSSTRIFIKTPATVELVKKQQMVHQADGVLAPASCILQEVH